MELAHQTTSQDADPTLLSERKARALEFFISSIRDPHNPTHCGSCLNGAFTECRDAEQWRPKEYVEPRTKSTPKYNPELWNPIVKFLSVKRSKEQIEQFLNRLAQCDCPMDPKTDGDIIRYHQPIPKGSQTSMVRIFNGPVYREGQTDEMKKLIRVWFEFISNLFLSLLVPIELSPRRSTAKGSSNSWPIKSTDMTPYGADSFVENMLQWHCFISDPIIFRLMGIVLSRSKQLIIPSLLKYKFTSIVIDSTKDAVNCLLERLKPTSANPPTDHIWVKFPYLTMDVSFYLNACLISVEDDDQRESLFQDCEIKATQLCSLIIYAYSAMNRQRFSPLFPINIMHSIAKDIADLCLIMFRLFHLHLPSRPSLLTHPLIEELRVMYQLEDESADSDLDPRRIALTTLRNFRVDTRCSVGGCLNSVHTVGNGFQRCGKCGVVGYCGRECQRKAWKDEDHPHKRLCPIMKDFVQKAGGPALFVSAVRFNEKDAGTVVWNLMSTRFDKADLDLIAGWEKSVVALRVGSASKRELSPGYTDYNLVIRALSILAGVEPVYLGRHNL